MTGMLYWKMPRWNSWKNKLSPSLSDYTVSGLNNLRSYLNDYEQDMEECQDQLAIDCGFNQNCAELVLSRPKNLISIIGDVMLLNLGDKFDCIQSPEYLRNFRNNGDWESVRQEYCSQLWIEANEISMNGFPFGEKLIFLQQGKSFQMLTCVTNYKQKITLINVEIQIT